MIEKDIYLYFPKCKILNAYYVPQAHGKHSVISMHLRSLITTPKHYPNDVMLNGKADFYFGLECTDTWKSNFETPYFKLFDILPNEAVKKLVKKEVSLITKFTYEGKIKLDTIGIGIPEGEITLYNSLLSAEDIDIIYRVSKLNYQLPKNAKTNKKLKI
jgi:hypothetical protein